MRVISWFSCGAASALATHLSHKKYNSTHEFEAVYCRVREEHEDNLRFLKDYEKYSWFLIKILLQNINKAPI